MFQISAAVMFLCSPAASFITGETIKVDGGHYMYSTSIYWEVPGKYAVNSIIRGQKGGAPLLENLRYSLLRLCNNTLGMGGGSVK